MNNLSVTPQTAKSLEAIETKALNAISEALAGKREVDDTIKLAMKAQNMVTKNRAIARSRDSMQLSVAKLLVSDAKQMERYIAASFPVVKKIVGKTS